MLLLNSKDCEIYWRAVWPCDSIGEKECIMAVLVSPKGKRIKSILVHEGRYSKTKIKPKELKRLIDEAFEQDCRQIVIAHNHPSCNEQPSEDDLLATKNLEIVLKAFKIELLDHIILTEDTYFSFRDAGLINSEMKQAG